MWTLIDAYFNLAMRDKATTSYVCLLLNGCWQDLVKECNKMSMVCSCFSQKRLLSLYAGFTTQY